MNFTSGATIYQEIHNLDQHLKDYYQHIVNIPVNSATRLLVDKEITTKQKQFDQCGKMLYVLKSDYEQRELELYEEINLWKNKYERLVININTQYGVKYADTDSVDPK